MVDLVPKSAGKFESSGIGDALLIGGIKAVEERALIPVIGNATLKSGVIKLVAGGVVAGAMKGKAGRLVGSAFAIDAVEDIVQSLLLAGMSGSEGGNTDGGW
jgi:hypothetical protein